MKISFSVNLPKWGAKEGEGENVCSQFTLLHQNIFLIEMNDEAYAVPVVSKSKHSIG